MRRFLVLASAAALLTACIGNGQKERITIATVLDQMTDLYFPCQYPEPSFVTSMTSSHDRLSVSPDSLTWFANNDGFGYERLECRDGREEKVLFESDRGGVITRIWLTTTTSRSTVRFYFDGSEEPGWVMNSFDFTDFGLKALEDNPLVQIHPNYVKGSKGGQTFFLPIPFEKSCRITLEEPQGWSGIPRYYQIDCRNYPEGVEIETFSVENAKKYSNAIRRAGKRLSEHSRKPSGCRKEISGVVPSGGSLTLIPAKGNRAVTELKIVVNGLDSTAYQQTMRDLVLLGSFDGRQTISVPLSDFSGAGMGAAQVESRQLVADGKGSVTSYWVMPYAREACFELVNKSGSDVEAGISARTVRRGFNGNTLYFHTSWHSESDLAVENDPSRIREWRFTRLEGRGLYMGDNLTLFNKSKAWYGEGDEHIYVDDEQFPSYFGTGTEDYYNCSWAPVHVFHTPFGGAPRADLATSQGYNTFFRTRLSDMIPFERSLAFDFEMISWVPGYVDCSSTVYWYGDSDSGCTECTDPLEFSYQLPQAPPDPAKFVVANSVEAESQEVVSSSDGLNHNVQEMSAFPDGLWSKSNQMAFFGGKQGDRATLRINGIEAGEYRLSLYYTKAADYGRISFHNGEKRLSDVIDCYFPSVVNCGPLDLGVVRVDSGSFDLDVVIEGKNEKSLGTMFGLDCFIFERQEHE